MNSDLCKICGERSDFIDAHIIPRSFYPERARGPNPLLVVSTDEDERVRRSRVGVYDKRLICAECEKIFDPYDNYAAKLLLDNIDDQKEFRHSGDLLVYQIEDFDYLKLKLFGLSMLWRAARTERREFQHVRLGPFLPRLTEMVTSGEAGEPDEFALIFSRFTDVEPWGSGVLSPFAERYAGLLFYRFVCGRYVVYIKVDQRRTPKSWSEIILRPDRRLYILARPFKGGPEERALRKAVRARNGMPF
jgi:hypothetical protein